MVMFLSERQGWIKASPKDLADFYLKCNTEQEFREEFLRHPLALLRENNIEVSPEASKEILQNIEYLKKNYELEIGIVPDWEEYGHELLKNGWGLLVKINSRGGSIP
jgi:hypothetical protein